MAKPKGAPTIYEAIARKEGIDPIAYIRRRLDSGEKITAIALDIGVTEIGLRSFLRRNVAPNGRERIAA